MTAFIFIFTLLLSPASAETDVKKFNHLALGDSLAHGTQHDRSNGDGYADFIAKQLNALDLLSSFNKDFAIPGHTTTGVLADILENKEVNGATIQSAMTEADIVTISAGVNDVLQHLDRETFKYDEAEMKAGLEAVKHNIETIVSLIKTSNPDADVYVMGYYNAFPYLPVDVQGNTILPLLSFLNDDIKQASNATGATFVRTDIAIEKNFEKYLPNKEDIHPGKDGYLLLANCFWKEMDLSQGVVFTDAIPDWAKDEVNHLVTKGLIKGYEDGSFRAQDEVSRLHAAYIINRGVIFESDEGLNPRYNDMTAESEGFDVVAKLSQNGVFEGDASQNFNPYKPLTRGEMAKTMVEAFHIKAESETAFKDVKGHWAEGYIQRLSATGAINGYPDQTFRPDQYITRAEFVKMMSFIIKPQLNDRGNE